MEGLSNIAIKTPQRLIATSIVSGYNFAIFCGTSLLDKRDEMSGRFGPRIIKISNLRTFAEEVQSILGAKRYFYSHVIYNDLKLFHVKTLKSFKLSKDNAPNNSFDPHTINDPIFDLLYDCSFLSSLFMKPTRFSVEDELRLVFEMPNDVPDVLRIADRGFLRRIEVVQ